MRSGFSGLNRVCSHEDFTGRESSCDYISHNCMSNNKMCALLIEFLLFGISSVYIHFSLPVSTYLDSRRVETRGVLSVFLDYLIELDYFCFYLSFT
jgi:hypothetical protein